MRIIKILVARELYARGAGLAIGHFVLSGVGAAALRGSNAQRIKPEKQGLARLSGFCHLRVRMR